VSSEPGRGHWFEPIADHLGGAYLRYAFTKGTDQEVGFLAPLLGLATGSRLLDVGCGPGRHAHAFARQGVEVVGLDVSERFVRLARQGAPTGARFVRGDARDLPFRARFDAVISLCQGGFGLLNGEVGDARVLRGMAEALRPGGRVALSAFSAYFRLRYGGDATAHEFDADLGVDHEWTVVRDEAGRAKDVELWTTCYTPRELRLLVAAAGLVIEHLWSVEPGAYRADPPDADHAEYLVVARKPGPDL